MTTITPQDLTTFQFERWPFRAPIIIEPGRYQISEPIVVDMTVVGSVPGAFSRRSAIVL